MKLMPRRVGKQTRLEYSISSGVPNKAQQYELTLTREFLFILSLKPLTPLSSSFFPFSRLSSLLHFYTMHHVSSTSSRALRRASAKAVRSVLARGAHKEIKFSNEGRAGILKGVDVLANAVSVTLGPKGLFAFCCSRCCVLVADVS